jgi:hypothetical protein
VQKDNLQPPNDNKCYFSMMSQMTTQRHDGRAV